MPLYRLKKISAVLFALAGIGLILWLDNWFMAHPDMPQLNQNMSYGLLLLVGALTGFHCVGMCGPLIVGYIAKDATAGARSHLSHLQYGLGKTLSYTFIGGMLGAFGAVIAFTPRTQGMVGMAAGVFLILFGLHMLNVFARLRHFYIKPPAFLMRRIGREYRKPHNPLVIGLLNGLMIICGPLQAMYVMAAASGSASEGARIMFFFGLGTLPMLLGFGFLTTLASANLTPKLLKASGVIVVILGAIMLNRGVALAGSGFDFHTLVARLSNKLSPDMAQTASCDSEQTVEMEVLSSRFVPDQFVVRKGAPVKWVIKGTELNACNKSIVVPGYDLKITLHPGTQVVEFTPQETGAIPWSCWMGMIPGSFIVVDNPPTSGSDAKEIASFYGQALDTVQQFKGGLERMRQQLNRFLRAW